MFPVMFCLGICLTVMYLGVNFLEFITNFSSSYGTLMTRMLNLLLIIPQVSETVYAILIYFISFIQIIYLLFCLPVH